MQGCWLRLKLDFDERFTWNRNTCFILQGVTPPTQNTKNRGRSASSTSFTLFGFLVWTVPQALLPHIKWRQEYSWRQQYIYCWRSSFMLFSFLIGTRFKNSKLYFYDQISSATEMHRYLSRQIAPHILPHYWLVRNYRSMLFLCNRNIIIPDCI